MEIEWRYRILETIRGDGSKWFCAQERAYPIFGWTEMGHYRDSMQMAQKLIDEKIRSRESERVISAVEHIYPPLSAAPAIAPSGHFKKWFRELWIWGR